MKHEQIGIARDDHCSFAVHREIQEFVIRRVPACRDPLLDGESSDALTARADAAMYAAKRGGRNRVRANADL